MGLTFIDESADGKRDTIRIIIPNPRTSPAGAKAPPKEGRNFWIYRQAIQEKKWCLKQKQRLQSLHHQLPALDAGLSLQTMIF
ncbi:MAG: hypothetical protein WDO16_09120 [Bacteroidota bacterium]